MTDIEVFAEGTIERMIVAFHRSRLGKAARFTTFTLATGAGQLIYSGRCRFAGLVVANLSAAAAAVGTVNNGQDSTGAAIVPISLPVTATLPLWFGPPGLDADSGLSVACTVGAITGAVYWYAD